VNIHKINDFPDQQTVDQVPDGSAQDQRQAESLEFQTRFKLGNKKNYQKHRDNSNDKHRNQSVLTAETLEKTKSNPGVPNMDNIKKTVNDLDP